MLFKLLTMDIGLIEQLNSQIKELETWDGQLFFPHDGPDNEKVELCLFLRLFCSVEHTYQFDPNKYAVAFAALEKVAYLTPTPAGAEKTNCCNPFMELVNIACFEFWQPYQPLCNLKLHGLGHFKTYRCEPSSQCLFTKSEITWIKTCACRCAMGVIDVEMTEYST